tara:strand:- start:443 stop:655 length:213 start_codon:yes stop_codon:yes gene_type:complete
MKLFQRLLVAYAALGLMAPIAVNADTNFSPTTTLDGSAAFTITPGYLLVEDTSSGEDERGVVVGTAFSFY